MTILWQYWHITLHHTSYHLFTFVSMFKADRPLQHLMAVRCLIFTIRITILKFITIITIVLRTTPSKRFTTSSNKRFTTSSKRFTTFSKRFTTSSMRFTNSSMRFTTSSKRFNTSSKRFIFGSFRTKSTALDKGQMLSIKR